MEHIRRCSRCILPSTLSSLKFDEEGVCNHCRDYERNFSEWESIREKKENELKNLLDKARQLKRPYDVLVPLSGGKDSTYVLYLCTKVHGLKTLAVTLDNGFLTQPAKNNIRNAIAKSNADHFFYTINRENSSELFSIFIRRTGDFCNACMRAINYAVEMALKNFKIPLIIRGSGRRVQYVSQIKEISSLNTASYFANVLKETPSAKKFRYLSADRHKLELQKITGGVADILGFSRVNLMRFIPQHIGIYDYLYLPFNEIIDILKKEMDWNDEKGTVEHLDCRLHDVPFYRDTLRIPGITPHTFHRSGLIRQGLMTRTEAVEMEEEELSKNVPPAELTEFLGHNNITFEEYRTTVLNSRKSKYEPMLQKLARDIYHKFRKY